MVSLWNKYCDQEVGRPIYSTLFNAAPRLSRRLKTTSLAAANGIVVDLAKFVTNEPFVNIPARISAHLDMFGM